MKPAEGTVLYLASTPMGPNYEQNHVTYSVRLDTRIIVQIFISVLSHANKTVNSNFNIEIIILSKYFLTTLILKARDKTKFDIFNIYANINSKI